MKKFSNVFKFNVSNICSLLTQGYYFRELFGKFYTLFIISKFKSIFFYKCRKRDAGVIIHHNAIIDGGRFIELHKGCYIQRGAWLSVPVFEMVSEPEDRAYLIVGQNVRIGPNCTISALNSIVIKENVVFGPNVMIVDHYHNYEDITKPVSNQGITSNGKILIQDGSWIGSNAVIYTSKNDLVVGKNSVVAANSVVRVSVPPYSIVSGNPAKIIKRYNFEEKKWISVGE